jgi:CubicO group peptidase (beta-lactamase class C family)
MASRVRGDLGTMRLARVLDARPESVRYLVEGSTGQWMECELQCEPVPPHRLLGMGFDFLMDEPPAADEPAPPAVELPGAIRGLVADRSADGRFSGAVLAVRGGETLYRGATGLANRRDGTPNREDTQFNLGSINKIMTKLAIAQLAEAGRLSLDDVASKHLPGLPREWADRITVSQLLEHRSGLGDFFGPGFEAADKSRIRGLRDYLALFAHRPLEFEPGTAERYSNAGYIVLGLIVEKLSGQSYYDYVRDHVFEPAGMTDSGWPMSDGPQNGIAMGYTRRDGGAEPGAAGSERENVSTRPGRGSSAGGGYSTLDDLLRLVRAIRDGKLLGPRWNAWFATGDLPAGTPNSAKLAGGGFGIAGGAPGLNAAIEADFGRDDCVIVLANLDPPAAESLARTLAGWLRQSK